MSSPTRSSPTSSSRRICGARLASALALAALLGCGPVGGTRAAPVRRPAATRPAPSLEGTFAWSHQSESGGVRRVEREWWTLESRAGAITGGYERRVSFLATGGVPFACSQSLSYTLVARYRVAGQMRGGDASLRETAAEVEPSPCETGTRALVAYRARRRGEALELEYQGGRQRLVPGPAPPPLDPPTIAGRWRWSTRHVDDGGVVRVEVERWQLRQRGKAIEGSYERRVTRFTSDGSPLACNGAARVERTDRYRVRGSRRGRRLDLAELDVETEAGPCAPDRRRHLDSARGQLFRDHIELIWRGDRRQVLGRPPRGR